MDQQYIQNYSQGQRSISPVRFDNDYTKYYNQQIGSDHINQRLNTSSSNQYGQQSFSSPQRLRTKPQIFQNTPPYLQQTAPQSNMNLSFGSPENNNNYENNNNNNQQLDYNLQGCQQSVQQLVNDKEMLQQEIGNLSTQILQLEGLLQQERRINRSVATELMIKVPSAERAIIQLNQENSRLQERVDQDKKLCSTQYLKSLELDNLRLTVKNKQLSRENNLLSTEIQDSLQSNQFGSLKVSFSPNKNQNSPFIRISLNCQKTENDEDNDNEQGQMNIEQSKSTNYSPVKSSLDNYHIQNYQNMEAKLLKLESYADILKQDNDKLEENNRILSKKLKTQQIEKDANESEYQQKILKLESLVTTFEYQLRKLKNQQQQQQIEEKQPIYSNKSELEYLNNMNSKIERNYLSNTNTIRIFHEGDVNIKIEGEALNKITSVSVINH